MGGVWTPVSSPPPAPSPRNRRSPPSSPPFMSRLNRLLSFVSSHPNGRKIYRASYMILCIHSNASYLSRPNASSVAGSFHYLGSSCSFHSTLPDDDPIHHRVSAHFTKIPVVVLFVAEAEYAVLFASTRIAVDERHILDDLGHPQPPTVISCATSARSA